MLARRGTAAAAVAKHAGRAKMTEGKRGRLTNVKDIHTFVLAGNATLTLVSEKTKVRYTYRIKRLKSAKEPKIGNWAKPRRQFNDRNTELWFVSVMYGPDNEADFTYIGAIRPARGFYRTAKSRLPETDARVQGWTWFWNKVSKYQMPEGVEVWHEGRCCCCGRKLTVPSSIDNGIGPECIKNFGAVIKREPELDLKQPKVKFPELDLVS